jgi:hypothetical protein
LKYDMVQKRDEVQALRKTKFELQERHKGRSEMIYKDMRPTVHAGNIRDYPQLSATPPFELRVTTNEHGPIPHPWPEALLWQYKRRKNK